jgi:hypothetical protein
VAPLQLPRVKYGHEISRAGVPYAKKKEIDLTTLEANVPSPHFGQSNENYLSNSMIQGILKKTDSYSDFQTKSWFSISKDRQKSLF